MVMLARSGSATLVAGSKLVTNTQVAADTLIFLTNNIPGGGVGSPYISSRDPSNNRFTITSTSGTDTSTIAWIFLGPVEISLLSNPPALSQFMKDLNEFKDIPLLQGSLPDSGINDNWLKWQQQITRIMNAVVNQLNT